MLPLNQRITVQFDEQGRNIQVVIVDAQDETAAEATSALAAGEFDNSDVFGAISDYAIVTVTENGATTEYTGERFKQIIPLADLGDVEPLWIKFEDIEPVEPAALEEWPAA